MKSKARILTLILILLALSAALALAVHFDVIKLSPESKSSCPVLMYHSVTEDPSAVSSVCVTQEKFRADMQWLKDNGYSFVLPSELAAGMPLPQKPVIVSFDDGYLDNYTLAFPVLKELGAKAEISVIVRLIEDDEYSSFCSWKELKEMSDSGLVEIGSHTYNLHNPESGGDIVPGGPNGVQRLEGESEEAYSARVTEDIKKSRSLISEQLGKDPCTFAYPYGAFDVWAGAYVDEKFYISFSTNPGLADLSKGRSNLPRYGVSMDTDLSKILK